MKRRIPPQKGDELLKYLKLAVVKIRDFYEIVIPCMAFLMMFSVFIYGIVCRYILEVSCTWANEIQIMGYLWTVLPGALWARRRNDHVCFALLYDSVDIIRQRIIRILGNLFMAVLYAFLFASSVKYISGLRQSSMALEISLKYLYLPFPIMVGGIWIYSVTDIVRDVRDIILEATGKKEKLQRIKIDKAAEYLEASEEEYKELFQPFEEDVDALIKEDKE